MTDHPSHPSTPPGDSSVRVPLAEDTLQVAKHEVTTGRVRVRTETTTHAQLVQADLMEEHVDVEHVAVDREVDEPPAVRVVDGVTIIPVLDEVVVIETRLVLREELHIRKRVERHTVEIPVALRRQSAVVEDTSDTTADPHPSSGKGPTP